MIDTGCLCFSVISENLVRNYDLYSEKITPRHLRLADGTKAKTIMRISRIKIDIDGRQGQIWGYVMPNLAYPLILGKPWIEYNDVVYSARRQSIRIGSRKHGMIFCASGWYEKDSPAKIQDLVSHVRSDQVSRLSSEGFSRILNRRKELQEIVLGVVLIHDITRALERKKKASRDDIRESLPKEIREYTSLFLDDDTSDQNVLPSHRPGLDTKVVLKNVPRRVARLTENINGINR
ncbi:hypothetical protein K3495_g8841 [Podosphaera aphanis]|nr:hypothetical protein K3495_g8841 [Podosphaera aphanis]